MRTPKPFPQYEDLNEATFQTLQVGDHLVWANQPEEVNGYVVTYVVKSANGVVTSIECEDDFEETTKLTSDSDLSTWSIEY